VAGRLIGRWRSANGLAWRNLMCSQRAPLSRRLHGSPIHSIETRVHRSRPKDLAVRRRSESLAGAPTAGIANPAQQASAQIGGLDQVTPSDESSDRSRSVPWTRLLPCLSINPGYITLKDVVSSGHGSPRRDQSASGYGFSDRLQGVGDAEHATLCEFAVF